MSFRGKGRTDAYENCGHQAANYAAQEPGEKHGGQIGAWGSAMPVSTQCRTYAGYREHLGVQAQTSRVTVAQECTGSCEIGFSLAIPVKRRYKSTSL